MLLVHLGTMVMVILVTLKLRLKKFLCAEETLELSSGQ
jgi:hypothetical protein